MYNQLFIPPPVAVDLSSVVFAVIEIVCLVLVVSSIAAMFISQGEEEEVIIYL